MKELEEFDLKKKYQEIAQRQKEFCTAYEVVKNERNKYVNQIQTCSQNLSEMKEKLKILQNEVEILRMDAASKDKLCKKEQVSHQQIRNERDQLRAELSQLHNKRDAFNEQVSLNVVEIDSLNRVITQREGQMAELKRQYEIAVEQRNFTGVELNKNIFYRLTRPLRPSLSYSPFQTLRPPCLAYMIHLYHTFIVP